MRISGCIGIQSKKNALRADDGDEENKRSDDSNENTLHLGVIGYETCLAWDVRLEVISTS